MFLRLFRLKMQGEDIMDRDVYVRMDALQGEHWWFKSRRNILTKVLGGLTVNQPHSRILEAGCGTGGNLAMLSNFGDVTGFEHDVDALGMAQEKGTFPLSQGTLPGGAPSYDDPFDLVVAFDVVEHIEDDLGSLQALRTQLRKDGKIVITVPAFPFLWSKHDETHHHFRRYTRKSLTEALRESGYEIEYVSYFNSLLFPLIAGIRMIKKFFKMDSNADDAMPSPVVNKVLSMIFGSEKHWVGRVSIPFGVSLIAIASNPSVCHASIANNKANAA